MQADPTVPTLDTVRSFLAEEHGLAVVSTVQADGAVLSTVVNCGVIDHPVTREPRVAFVSLGGEHDDWDTYDQTMRDQARTAVLVNPDRIRGNH